jgi:hypothetical protein
MPLPRSFFGFLVVLVVDEVLVVVGRAVDVVGARVDVVVGGGSVDDVVGRTVEDVEGRVVVVESSSVDDVELLVVTRVLDVEDGCGPATVLVVGRLGRATVVVVVVVVSAGNAGHADGAGAFRAANFPGSSRRTSPPKSMQ